MARTVQRSAAAPLSWERLTTAAIRARGADVRGRAGLDVDACVRSMTRAARRPTPRAQIVACPWCIRVLLIISTVSSALEPLMRIKTQTSPSEGSAKETTVISRRELARELRRKAYRDAKARRDADPRFLAMKEAAKQRRRDQYQLAKAKKKAVAASGAASSGSARWAQVRGKTEERPIRDRSIKESSSKADNRAALARALGALREVREQKAAQHAREQQPSSELIECVIQAGEREGAANDSN